MEGTANTAAASPAPKGYYVFGRHTFKAIGSWPTGIVWSTGVPARVLTASLNAAAASSRHRAAACSLHRATPNTSSCPPHTFFPAPSHPSPPSAPSCAVRDAHVPAAPHGVQRILRQQQHHTAVLQLVGPAYRSSNPRIHAVPAAHGINWSWRVPFGPLEHHDKARCRLGPCHRARPGCPSLQQGARRTV